MQTVRLIPNSVFELLARIAADPQADREFTHAELFHRGGLMLRPKAAEGNPSIVFLMYSVDQTAFFARFTDPAVFAATGLKQQSTTPDLATRAKDGHEQFTHDEVIDFVASQCPGVLSEDAKRIGNQVLALRSRNTGMSLREAYGCWQVSQL